MTTMLDTLNTLGVSGIIALQNQFPDSEEFFDSITQVFDPAYAYTILFPLVVALNTKLATDLIVVSAVTEWLNMILKWLLREDRPFWWVQETSVYGTSSPDSKPTFKRPYMKQTPLTCETGPGSPSGHMMAAAALGYIVVQTVVMLIHRTNKFNVTIKKLLSCVTWVAFAALMALVATSRLYVATHFPHQCILGAVCGVGVAWCFTSPSSPVTNWWRTSSRPLLLLAALTATLSTVACYWLQKAFGIDPQWSVKLAFKWCEQPDYIHINTTPLYCLVRDCGIFFGLALAAPLNKTPTRLPIIIAIFTTVCLGWAFDLAGMAIPTADVYVFYGCQFLMQATQPFIYLVCLPNVARIMKKKFD